MSSSFFKPIINFFIFVFIIILFITCLFPVFFNNDSDITYSSGDFIWPLPGYTYISSSFGYRNSPTAGASSYHSGIDIPAPNGTPILAVYSGKVTFCSWGAGGGYTIVIENDATGLSFSYCHVSPIFIVSRGDYINTGDIISSVGPKNVYGILNNPYKDSSRPSNKWRYHRLSFTFNNKKRRQSRQSIKLHIIIIVVVIIFFITNNILCVFSFIFTIRLLIFRFIIIKFFIFF